MKLAEFVFHHRTPRTRVTTSTSNPSGDKIVDEVTSCLPPSPSLLPPSKAIFLDTSEAERAGNIGNDIPIIVIPKVRRSISEI